MSLVLSQSAITNFAVAPQPFDDIEDMFHFRPHLALPPIPLPVAMVKRGAAIASALHSPTLAASFMKLALGFVNNRQTKVCRTPDRSLSSCVGSESDRQTKVCRTSPTARADEQKNYGLLPRPLNRPATFSTTQDSLDDSVPVPRTAGCCAAWAIRRRTSRPALVARATCHFFIRALSGDLVDRLFS